MLDTNIVSELIPNPSGHVAERVRAAGEEVCVSIIVAAELRYGCMNKGSPELLRRIEQFLSEVPVLPFAVPADVDYGVIRGQLEAVGRPIGSNDLLIAAHASALGVTVVSANSGEFACVSGLRVENWLM